MSCIQSFTNIISVLLFPNRSDICVYAVFCQTAELWLEWVRRNVETALPITFTCVTQNLISSPIIWKCRRNENKHWKHTRPHSQCIFLHEINIFLYRIMIKFSSCLFLFFVCENFSRRALIHGQITSMWYTLSFLDF